MYSLNYCVNLWKFSRNVFNFHKMKDEKTSVYVQEAAKLNIEIVYLQDKKEVVDYLLGNITECSKIDPAMRTQTLVKKSDIRMGKTVQV